MIRILITFVMAVSLSGCMTDFSSLTTIQITPIEEVTGQCDAGNTEACLEAGRRYRNGSDAPEDINLAVKYLSAGCRGKNRKACETLYKVGWDMYKTNKYARDDAALLEMFELSCTGDFGPACATIAYNYEKGKGVAKNPAKALELYEKGCVHGSSMGCDHAGDMYISEKNVARNPAKAKSLYEKGCAWKNSGACAGLGTIYLKGDGVKQDYNQAYIYYSQSCDKAPSDNDNAGCFALAQLYDQGLGCPQDKAEAVRLYGQACRVVKPKNAEACVKLAQAYQTGTGIKPDANAAHEYFRLACTLGNREGCVGQYKDECDRLKIPKACEWLKKN
jgi:TPR repeat protein